MNILIRVLAKNLYHLDLSDLPLDPLSEQKTKKGEPVVLNYCLV